MRHAALAGLLSLTLYSCGGERGPAEGAARGAYLAQPPPGPTAEVFAPGLVSLPDRYEYSIAFSPDLSECVFGVTDSAWATFTMLYTRMGHDGSWSDPVPAPFQGGGDGLSPAFSRDGSTVYFASSRPAYPPANLWKAVRSATGWSEAVMVSAPVSTSFDEFAPSLTSDGVLYFVSGRNGGLGEADIYRASPVDAGFTVENVGAPINSPHLDSTPFIDPDERYMLFESDRPGGHGQQDIYVSFRDGDAWGTPKNLGPAVNTEQIEDEPYVSPDGKYLFFNRREGWVTSQQTEIHWIDLKGVLDSL